MSERVTIKVTYPHVDVELDDPTWVQYHEWIPTATRIRADRTGRQRPSMYSTEWTLWRCNNPDCSAQALVHDDAIRSLLPPAVAAP